MNTHKALTYSTFVIQTKDNNVNFIPMKNLIKTGLLSVALLTSLVANASKIITTASAKDKVVYIGLTNISKGEIISIKDTDGVRLYSEVLEQDESFNKKFDFSTTPSGIYFIETKEAKEITVTPVIVSEDKVSIITDSSKRFRAPSVKLEGTIARVLVRNFNEVPVEINIYDTNGETLKTETRNNLLIYNAYNFSDLKEGTYTISVTQGDYNFTETIKL